MDGIPIGAFNINVYSKEEQVIKFIAENISLLSTAINTHTFYHEITIPSLKEVSLIPRKNYETNKLEYGKFQLPYGTHFILNETNMKEG